MIWNLALWCTTTQPLKGNSNATTWMSLEDIVLSEISQPPKDKYHVTQWWEALVVVTLTETEAEQWVPGAGGQGVGSTA